MGAPTLPILPLEGENNWFGKRNAFDQVVKQAIESSFGLDQRTVNGNVTITAKNNWVYELNVTAASTITFNSNPGAQIAVVLTGLTASVQGQSIKDGETWVFVCLNSGWKPYQVGGTSTPAPGAPTAGNLNSSAISQNGFTLTVAGATAPAGFHATPYSFSTDNGATWSAWQASSSFTATGKTAGNTYQCLGRVRDVTSAIATTGVVSVTTTSSASWTTVASDAFAAPDGTALQGRTSDTGGLTYTAGSNVTIVSNKMDIYPWGNTQNWVTSEFNTSVSKHRASIDYMVPSHNGGAANLEAIRLLVGAGGVSASKGAGNFGAKMLLNPVGSDVTGLNLTVTSQYDGDFALAAQGGKNLSALPLMGNIVAESDGSVVRISVDGTLWAIATPPSGCTLGTKVSFGGIPDNSYGFPHWTIDNLKIEKFA